MTLLSNATGLRGVACTIVKITVKDFSPFVMLAVDYMGLEICDSDILLKCMLKKSFCVRTLNF